ncbi:MAG: transketolase C-terminal domain-containing protein, partial [Candidatus Micrarchaeota archaeon]
LEKIPGRFGYGDGLVELGRENENVMVLCCDLTGSTRVDLFKKAFPKRFLQIGVAEQNMAQVAVGLALEGKIPFISSYAVFSPGRNWDQIRISVCYNETNVKLAGAHAGISVGPDGATHQALEDIATMRVLPMMTVVVPCDYHEAKKATIALGRMNGPCYFRFGRDKIPVITTPNTPFEVGRAEIYRDGTDVAIVACGPLVYEALVAAEELAKKGINAMVVNNHTIKPIDDSTLEKVARKCGAVVTAEEHQITGGMGSAVAESLAKTYPVPMEFVGMPDHFGESGTPAELMKKWGMTSPAIIAAAEKVLKRK